MSSTKVGFGVYFFYYRLSREALTPSIAYHSTAAGPISATKGAFKPHLHTSQI